MKQTVPDFVTKAYENFIRSPAANISGRIDYLALYKIVQAECKLSPAWGHVLTCRVWANLKSQPDNDREYKAKREALEANIALTAWIEGPDSGGVWTARPPPTQLKPVPDHVNDIYNSIVCNKDGVYPSTVGMKSFTKLSSLIRSFFHPDDWATARLVSLRLWHKLTALPKQDAVYCAQFKAENQVYDLQDWFTQPEPSTPQPDKAKEVSIQFRNIDYTELEARMMAESQTYQKQFLSEISDDLDENRVFPKELINRSRANMPRGPRSLLISTPTGQDSWPRFEPDHREFSFPQPPKKVITMNANKPYENISYVYGVAATTASDAHLINSIKRVDTEINRLSDLKGTSKKVDAMVKSLEGDKAAIVAILDSRP